MPQPSGQLPISIRTRSRFERLAADRTPFTDGGPPALLVHPEEGWDGADASPTPAPIVLWFHGRSVSKELDPGRYVRWAKLGIAACAIDLPAHGERIVPEKQTSEHTLEVVEQAADEVDLILDDLSHPRFNGAFDTSRLAIGGMSAGGMAALVRLCRPHEFSAAILEATCGSFEHLADRPFYIKDRVARLNPIDHLDEWRPIPLLAVHSKLDEWLPVEAMEQFVAALKQRHADQDADPDWAQLHVWDKTGAPHEHLGFGTKTNDTKNMENQLLAQHLLG